MTQIIRASQVRIRDFSCDSKCSVRHCGACLVKKEDITKEMRNLPAYYESGPYLGAYIPENFCRGLAAKYLFPEPEETLFSRFKCVQYACGHIELQSDGNHRMCVLQKLDQLIEVEMKQYDGVCTDCETKMHKKAAEEEAPKKYRGWMDFLRRWIRNVG